MFSYGGDCIADFFISSCHIRLLMTARNTGQTGGSSVSAAEKLTVVRSVRSIPMHAGYHRSARLSECLRFFKMGCFVQNLTDDRARATWLRPDRLSERV